MGVSADAPYLDTANKLVAYYGRPVMKLSPGKVTQPGAKQVFRGPEGDLPALREETAPPGWRPRLAQVMGDGHRATGPELLDRAREQCPRESGLVGRPGWRLHGPEPVCAQVSAGLAALQDQLSWAAAATLSSGPMVTVGLVIRSVTFARRPSRGRHSG